MLLQTRPVMPPVVRVVPIQVEGVGRVVEHKGEETHSHTIEYQNTLVQHFPTSQASKPPAGRHKTGRRQEAAVSCGRQPPGSSPQVRSAALLHHNCSVTLVFCPNNPTVFAAAVRQ